MHILATTQSQKGKKLLTENRQEQMNQTQKPTRKEDRSRLGGP